MVFLLRIINKFLSIRFHKLDILKIIGLTKSEKLLLENFKMRVKFGSILFKLSTYTIQNFSWTLITSRV